MAWIAGDEAASVGSSIPAGVGVSTIVGVSATVGISTAVPSGLGLASDPSIAGVAAEEQAASNRVNNPSIQSGCILIGASYPKPLDGEGSDLTVFVNKLRNRYVKFSKLDISCTLARNQGQIDGGCEKYGRGCHLRAGGDGWIPIRGGRQGR